MALSRSARNSFYVFTGTLTSRILGFVRVVLIGTTLGYTRISDSYNLSNEIPNMVYELILGSLIASTTIPFFVRQYKTKDRHADNAVIFFIFISSLLLTVLTLLFAPVIADFMTSFNTSSSANAQQDLVLFFLWFFIPQIFFYAMTASMQSFLAARSRFVAAAYAPILNNVIVISTLLFIRANSDALEGSIAEARKSAMAKILALGTTGGVVSVFMVLFVVYISAGGRLKIVSLRDSTIKLLVSRSKWMVGYAVVNQITLFLIIAFANSIPGGVAMYLVAWSFFQLPQGLFANSIMTTMVPRISHTLDVKEDKPEDFHVNIDTININRFTTSGLIVVMGVISSLMTAVAIPALTILLAHGNISVDQAQHTGRILIGFLIFLPAFSLYLFCVRIANVLDKAKIIFYICVLQNLLNIILALLLKNTFTTTGLALAFSGSYFIVVPLSILVIEKQLGASMLNKKLLSIMIPSCILAAIFGYLTSANFENNFIAVLFGSLVCLFILLIGAFFARADLIELKDLIIRNPKSPTTIKSG